MYVVYILHSIKLDRFYIGYTSNFFARLDFHAMALPHKFTSNADDWTVFFIIECESKIKD